MGSRETKTRQDGRRHNYFYFRYKIGPLNLLMTLPQGGVWGFDHRT